MAVRTVLIARIASCARRDIISMRRVYVMHVAKGARHAAPQQFVHHVPQNTIS